MSENFPLKTRVTLEDAERAFYEWGANCGPAALAVMLGLPLEQVRPHIPDFETRRYTNPRMMLRALKSLRVIGASCEQLRSEEVNQGRLAFPSYGLARIQWEGPWTKPGVPIAARYRHTHWVGAMRFGSVGIFDVNCLNNGSGWVSLEEWEAVVVPWILKECVPRASGAWHITHAIELPPALVERIATPRTGSLVSRTIPERIPGSAK